MIVPRRKRRFHPVPPAKTRGCSGDEDRPSTAARGQHRAGSLACGLGPRARGTLRARPRPSASSTTTVSLGLIHSGVFGTGIDPRFQVTPASSLTIVAVTLGRWAWPPVPVESHTGTTRRPLRSWMPCAGPVASTFQS